MKNFYKLCQSVSNYSFSGKGASPTNPVIPSGLRFYRRESATYANWDEPFCHSNYIFVYMLDGERMVSIDDFTFFLKKGDAILIPPYARHVFGGEHLYFQSLMASFHTGEKEERLLRACKTKFRLKRRDIAYLSAAVRAFQRWQNGELFAAEESVCHFALLLRQVQNMTIPAVSSSKLFDHDYPLLSAIVEYLSNNRDHHVTLTELSNALHVSGSTIRQTFQQKMKQTIGHYQLVRRLNLGCELLKSTNLSIAEIAAKVGFAYPNSFLRAIKRETGETPHQMRERFWNNIRPDSK